MKRKKIRSKHNDLMNYFIHDERDLSPAYVASCRKFLNSLRNHGLVTKQQANNLFKQQAASRKRQATSFKLDKYIADRIRWLMGIPPGEVDEDK